MKAWVIHKIVNLSKDQKPLERREMPDPAPGPGELLIKISVCAVCHTELDEIEGRTPPSRFPMIPGHQVAGTVSKTGPGVRNYASGDRVGVAWIFSSCRKCHFCLNRLENLCPEFLATGRDMHGGYAEYMIAKEDFCFRIPANITDHEAAPLLCAGAIGYRALLLTRASNGMTFGLSGFGASAHLVMKMIRYKFPDSKVYVFARGDREKKFADELGAAWTGDFESRSPVSLDAIIDTTPAWKPVIKSMENLKPGGRLIINAIRKEDIDRSYLLNLSYHDHIWMEKEIKSVANITRHDIAECLNLCADAGIVPELTAYDFDDVNRALNDLNKGKSAGAKVIRVS